MPTRDHFRPPLENRRHWEGLHGGWPMMIVAGLQRTLPAGYFAEPRVHSGSSAEIDVATFDDQGEVVLTAGNATGNGGGIATAVWAPPLPTLAVVTDLPTQDTYEVLVYDEKRHCRLVAAVEIVSPANKDRPAHRRSFVAKCAGLLRERVSVVIVDVVTTRTANLYQEMLDFVGHSDPSLGPEPPPLYAAACRLTKRADEWVLETWTHLLGLGRPLPTVPLWLADDLAVPLELEESYEQSCGILNIPRI
ncbi:MAG TPA: DUF4058 family protein [Pirellulales bacterium]|nr:DUF4058 family protein [Pirellulales bacterium]